MKIKKELTIKFEQIVEAESQERIDSVFDFVFSKMIGLSTTISGANLNRNYY